MTKAYDPDTLHRLMKHAIDAGTVRSVEEAEALFNGYRISIEVGVGAANDPVHQASLLTAVALARRVFLGGVHISGDLNRPLLLDIPAGETLKDAVCALGGLIGEVEEQLPTIVIGGNAQEKRDRFCVRTCVGGWRGGVVPVHSTLQPQAGPAMPLSGMLAAALAVNEAYLHVQAKTSVAGHAPVGLSLWRPSSDVDWLAIDESEPTLTYLPSRLWLIGLGHLGQAYLWALGLLPYANPHEVHLVLQDTDCATPSTESTSILTDGQMVDERKTRSMAAWALRRGFTASIHERRFGADFRRQSDEPCVALCGIDNGIGRQALESVGFDLVVEAGLGHGWQNFRKMRIHVLPGSRTAHQIWQNTTGDATHIVDRSAYRDLLDKGALDQCGITLLAGKAVGAPFVGAVAATLVVSEVLRLLHGGSLTQLIDLDLQDIDQRFVSINTRDLSALNPGFAAAA